MKLAGLLLLGSGWVIVLAALPLLAELGMRTAFVLAGEAVEILGLVLLIRSHLPANDERQGDER